MAAKQIKEGPQYGIGAVAKLTGLTDHAIRVWERRYGAVVARRAPNGRRVYSAKDVEKLGLLKRLTDQGISIGQIASGSIEELREQCQSVSDIASVSLPEQIGIAVLGDYLPARLLAHTRDISPVEVRVADSNLDRFSADLRRQSADVVVLECPVLDREKVTQLVGLMKDCGAGQGIVIFGFGRSRDVEEARQSGLVALRAPVDVDEFHAAVIRSFAPPATGTARPKRPDIDEAPRWHFAAESPPRLFNQQQIAQLASASSTIDCECPNHLAQLVGDLSAFEIYSANCANRDDDDAALHRYLHQTTAQARALIEAALKKVADAEGLTY